MWTVLSPKKTYGQEWSWIECKKVGRNWHYSFNHTISNSCASSTNSTRKILHAEEPSSISIISISWHTYTRTNVIVAKLKSKRDKQQHFPVWGVEVEKKPNLLLFKQRRFWGQGARNPLKLIGNLQRKGTAAGFVKQKALNTQRWGWRGDIYSPRQRRQWSETDREAQAAPRYGEAGWMMKQGRSVRAAQWRGKSQQIFSLCQLPNDTATRNLCFSLVTSGLLLCRRAQWLAAVTVGRWELGEKRILIVIIATWI